MNANIEKDKKSISSCSNDPKPENNNEVNSTVGPEADVLIGTPKVCSKNYRKNEVLNESFFLDVPSKIKRGSDKSLDESFKLVKKVVRSASNRFMVLGVKYVNSPIISSYNFFSKPWINRSVPLNDVDVVTNVNQLRQKLSTPIYQNNFNLPMETQQSIFEIYTSMSSKTSYKEIKMIVIENYLELRNVKIYLRGITNILLYSGQKVDENYETLMQLNDLDASFKAVDVPKDGNCFYNSLSLFYFGTTAYYYVFRVCLNYILVENEEIMKDFLIVNCGYTNQEFLKSLEDSVKTQEWADFINISSASILLKRAVSIISLSKENVPFKTVYGIPEDSGLLIGFYNSHFVPILKINDDVKEPNNLSMTVFDKFDRFMEIFDNEEIIKEKFIQSKNRMVKPVTPDHSDIENYSIDEQFYNISQIRNMSFDSINSDTDSIKRMNGELNLQSVSKRAVQNKNSSKLYINNKVSKYSENNINRFNLNSVREYTKRSASLTNVTVHQNGSSSSDSNRLFSQMKELKIENLSLKKKLNDPNLVENTIKQLINKTKSGRESSTGCPIIMLCKGVGNCRNGKNHKTLESCPYFKSSKFEKDQAISKKSFEADKLISVLKNELLSAENNLIKEQNKLNAHNIEKEKETKHSNDKINDLEKKLTNENNQVLKLADEVRDLKISLSNAGNILNDETNEREKLEQERNTNNLVVENTKLNDLISRLEQNLNSKNTENEKLGKNLAISKKALEHKDIKRKDVSSMITKYEQQIDESSSKIISLEQKLKDIKNKLETENTKLFETKKNELVTDSNNQLQIKDIEISDLKNKLNEQERISKDLEENWTNSEKILKQETERINLEKSNLEVKIRDITAKDLDKNNEINDLNDKHSKETDNFSKLFSNLNKKISIFEKDLQTKVTSITELEKKLTNERQNKDIRLTELESKITSSKKIINEQSESFNSEKSKLEEAKKVLESKFESEKKKIGNRFNFNFKSTSRHDKKFRRKNS